MVAGRCLSLNTHFYSVTACTTVIGAESAKHRQVDMLAIEEHDNVETPMALVAFNAIVALQLVEWGKGEA